MNSLKYLFLTTLKNRITETFKRPSKLILTIIFILLLAFVFIVSFIPDNEKAVEQRSITELYTIIFILFYMIFILNAVNGFATGASFYTMADINLLFVSPVSSKKILIFGLLKQIGTSFFLGFFLLFLYTWLNGTYGIDPLGMFAIFIGYCLTLFCSQVTALAIYTFTTGHDTGKKIIKAFFAIITVLIAGYILFKTLPSGNFLESAVKAADSDFFLYIPVAGWLKMFTVGVISGVSSYIYTGLGLTFITILILTIFIFNI
jgi:hypothetical protein